jgi:hypothetical protein
MKLISRIALRLSLALLPLMALWGVLFYFTMVDEINDEADDALEDYSELIVKRMLAARGKPVLYLKRLSMGPLELDPELVTGGWRPLTEEERKRLKELE